MQKPTIFVTRNIPDIGINLLKAKGYTIRVNSKDKALKKKEIIKNIKGCDCIISLLTDTIDSDVLKANPCLKIVSNYAAGYNNIDVKSATEKGIAVTNTPDVLTETTADLTFALLLSAARRIVSADNFLRKGKFKGWNPMLYLGEDIYGKTLGIIGLGRIGHAVAKRANKGFGMKILYHDVKQDMGFEKEYDARFMDKESLLKQSDFISLHVPLLPETRHLIGKKEFSIMKKAAILINTSRGPVVDEKALATALKEKKIFAAGLDVFENEPAVEPLLIKLDNAVIVPHVGSASRETRDKMSEMAAMNIIRFFEGQQPLSIVNPEVLQKRGE